MARATGTRPTLPSIDSILRESEPTVLLFIPQVPSLRYATELRPSYFEIYRTDR